MRGDVFDMHVSDIVVLENNEVAKMTRTWHESCIRDLFYPVRLRVVQGDSR